MSRFNTENVLPFSYTPLANPHRDLRLLRVHPSNEDEPIRCTIEIADVSHEYICLSYMWGTDKDSNLIFIDDQRFYVRDNLLSFLRQARRTPAHLGQPLWIDAICIDQQAVKEKNAQVALMGEIYKCAVEVVAWLGEGEKSVEDAFDFIALRGHGEHEHPDKARRLFVDDRPSLDEYRTALDIFSSLQYWSRMWTVQEILLAKVLTVCYGSRQMSANCVENITYFVTIENMDPSQKQMLSLKPPIHLTPFGITLKRRNVQRYHRVLIGREINTSLFTLFRKNHMYGCHHERDKIYALRALDTHGGQNMPVDYSADAATVMCDAMENAESVNPLGDGFRLMKLLSLSVSQLRLQTSHVVKGKTWKERVNSGNCGIILSSFYKDKDQDPNQRIWTVHSFPKGMFRTWSITQIGDTAHVLRDGDLFVRFDCLKVFMAFRPEANTESYHLGNELQQIWEQKYSPANESRREEIIQILEKNVQDPSFFGTWVNHYKTLAVLICPDDITKSASLSEAPKSLSNSFETPGLEFLRLCANTDDSLQASIQSVRITRPVRTKAFVLMDWPYLLDFWAFLEEQQHLYQDVDNEVETPWR